MCAWWMESHHEVLEHYKNEAVHVVGGGGAESKIPDSYIVRMLSVLEMSKGFGLVPSRIANRDVFRFGKMMRGKARAFKLFRS